MIRDAVKSSKCNAGSAGMSQTIDAEYEPAPLATRENPGALAAWTPSFAVAVDEAIERKRQKVRFFKEVMEKDLHYGVIPGTGTKPTLLKPGAEMLLANMGLQAEFSDAEPPIVDITGKDHGGEPYIRYHRRCTIYRQTGPHEEDRMIVARADGTCSSWETKYRYRNEQRKCPQCGKPAIIKGKEEYGGGYVCFKKKDGCGAKFADRDPAIESQTVGKVANPDVADLENTILKMGDKRALVAGALVATGCSDIFTQDVEDNPPPGDSDPSPTDAVTTPRATSASRNGQPPPMRELERRFCAATAKDEAAFHAAMKGKSTKDIWAEVERLEERAAERAGRCPRSQRRPRPAKLATGHGNGSCTRANRLAQRSPHLAPHGSEEDERKARFVAGPLGRDGDGDGRFGASPDDALPAGRRLDCDDVRLGVP